MLKTTIGSPGSYRFTGVIDKTARSQMVRIDTRNEANEVTSAETMTVEQYYKKKYNVTLRFPDMPLLQCGPKEKCLYFPIEALIISDRVQRIRRKLPEDLQPVVTQVRRPQCDAVKTWWLSVHFEGTALPFRRHSRDDRRHRRVQGSVHGRLRHGGGHKDAENQGSCADGSGMCVHGTS